MKVRYKPNIVNAIKWDKNIGHGYIETMYEVNDMGCNKTLILTEEQFEKMFEIIEQNQVMKNPYFETEE